MSGSQRSMFIEINSGFLIRITWPYRDLQNQCCRSPCLSGRYAHRHRQRPQADPDWRAITVELCGGVSCSTTLIRRYVLGRWIICPV